MESIVHSGTINARAALPLLCLWGLALVGFCIPCELHAQGGEPPRTEGAQVTPGGLKVEGELKKLGPDQYQLGNLRIDAAKRQVICPGRINMDEGPLELLACTSYGKLHESLLELKTKPVHLHVALLLLNLDPGRNPGVNYPPGAPQLKHKPGDRVLLFVRWKEKAAGNDTLVTKTVRAEELLLNVKTGKVMRPTSWVFQGSCMVESRIIVPPKEGEARPDDKPNFKTMLVYGAGVDGSIITTYHDPIAVIENPLDTVNDDIYYVPYRKALPRVGTPMELVIVAVPKKAEKAPEKPADSKAKP